MLRYKHTTLAEHSRQLRRHSWVSMCHPVVVVVCLFIWVFWKQICWSQEKGTPGHSRQKVHGWKCVRAKQHLKVVHVMFNTNIVIYKKKNNQINNKLMGECVHLYANFELWAWTFWRWGKLATDWGGGWSHVHLIRFTSVHSLIHVSTNSNPAVIHHSSISTHIILPSSEYILERWVALVDAWIVKRCVAASLISE